MEKNRRELEHKLSLEKKEAEAKMNKMSKRLQKKITH